MAANNAPQTQELVLAVKKEPYIGSVRFYKNMILLFVIAAILLPTVSAIRLKGRVEELENTPPTVPDSSVDITALNSESLPYQTMFTDFYAPSPYDATQRISNTVYLTFDCTSAGHTEDLLAVLAEEQVQATFFVCGAEDADTLTAIADAGHTVGMLSYSADYLSIYASVEAYLADMEQIYNHIKDATGTAPTVFRFLGGSINNYNTAIYHQLIAEMVRRGFVAYDWNCSVENNSRQQNPSLAVTDLLSQIAALDRAIISLPDDGTSLSETILPELIEKLQRDGFALSKLDGTIKPVSFAYTD